MRTYEIEVAKINSFTIEIDETIWDAAELADWSKHFFTVENVQEIAEHLAKSIISDDVGQFYEGYGHVKTFYEDGRELKQFIFIDSKNCNVTEFAKGIKVIILGDDHYECDSSEVETEK